MIRTGFARIRLILGFCESLRLKFDLQDRDSQGFARICENRQFCESHNSMGFAKCESHGFVGFAESGFEFWNLHGYMEIRCAANPMELWDSRGFANPIRCESMDSHACEPMDSLRTLCKFGFANPRIQDSRIRESQIRTEFAIWIRSDSQLIRTANHRIRTSMVFIFKVIRSFLHS